jgi:quinoprotein glucose dehydrogenase
MKTPSSPGFRAPETKPALCGDIRAYDVRTGKLRWIFHTIPRPGELVTKAGLRMRGRTQELPTTGQEWRSIRKVESSTFPPFRRSTTYGADRVGNDLYANTLLALDAATGKRIWSFQGVHHDLWERDLPSPPTLVTIRSRGKATDALAQTTKQGFLYLFDWKGRIPSFPNVEMARLTSLLQYLKTGKESNAAQSASTASPNLKETAGVKSIGPIAPSAMETIC